jgi:citrate synthase
MATHEINSGLEGVLVAATRLSEVDGEHGRLLIAGHDVEDLARSASFEAVCALLWTSAGPETYGEVDVRAELGAMRVRAWSELERLGDALRAKDGMEALRASVAHLDLDGVAPAREHARVTAAVTVFAAAWARTRAGEPPIAPSATASTADDYLRMVTGTTPGEPERRALDVYLTTVSDHGLNASTFAARVIASTQSDTVSAVVGALGALKGPLHGGAPGPVLDMLDAVGHPDRASAWIDAELSRGRRIMGMGHRIYRVRDPRAAVFERAIAALHSSGAHVPRLPVARAVEGAAVGALAAKYPARALATNVEFYTAVLLDALGLPREVFTPTFAVGRVAGWSAHIAEQRAKGRLIRPSSHYIGERPAARAERAPARC